MITKHCGFGALAVRSETLSATDLKGTEKGYSDDMGSEQSVVATSLATITALSLSGHVAVPQGGPLCDGEFSLFASKTAVGQWSMKDMRQVAMPLIWTRL